MVERRMVLVTGAAGFIGSALVVRLVTESMWKVVASIRVQKQPFAKSVKVVQVGEVGADTDWSLALQSVQVVVHAAAVTHVSHASAGGHLTRLRMTNVEGALNLARQASAAGVKRFIFISTIKVNGEATTAGRSFSPSDTPAPEDSYGISKLEAERGLMQLAHETGMEVVIIRPPLVYGPGVKGNFASLIKLVAKGLPLPLGAIHNKRSLVGIDNLIDLIIRCIDHPAAANQVFLAGDGDDLSTTELLSGIAEAMGRSARLIPVPAGLLRMVAVLLGKRAVAQRVLGSLQVDISKARDLLGWEPPISVEEGLRRCVRDSSV